MDRLRKLIEYISQQLKLLTISQQLALALSAALVVVSVLWLVQWSSEPELVQLVNRRFEYEELDDVEEVIRQANVPYKVVGTRIYVRPEDKRNLIRLVAAADALPEGSLYDLAQVVQESSPFDPPSLRDIKHNYARANELSQIISTSPIVESARVVINNKEKRRLGGMGYEATASVFVSLKRRESLSHAKAEGFARLVASSVEGLKPHNVSVINADTMVTHKIPHPDDPGSVDMIGKTSDYERRFEEKIRLLLSNIPNVLTTVTVRLDASKTVTESADYGSTEVYAERTESTEQATSREPTEPGVQPNLGKAVTAGVSGGKSSREKSDTENFAPNIIERKRTEQFPFSIERVTAAISIPRSFVVSVYKAQFPDGEDVPAPDNADYVNIRTNLESSVRDNVVAALQANPQDVQVDVYPDMNWDNGGGSFAAAPDGAVPLGVAGESLDTFGMLTAYGPQAGMVFLALMSLMMMMRVARRSADELAGSEEEDDEEEDDLVFDADGASVGEATSASSFLVGREMSDDLLRVKELTEEVSKLVESDPGTAAELLNQWIAED
ncbi:MAG: flagellar M-ring protein FliF C-terminal domain-containing protein [Phycisphaerae bacterium]